MSTYLLDGKNAMVCGSTSGIGKAIAIEFAKAGANVTLVARSKDRLTATLKELSVLKKQNHSFVVADFENPNELQSALADFLSKGHIIHILVNNTGGPNPGLIIESNPDQFRIAFNAHLICNQILVQALAPGMKKEKFGRIINVISTAVREPIVGLGVSGTVRHAVAAWAKMLSKELALFGITVNNILPGATDTGRIEQILEDKAKRQNKSVEELKGEMLKQIPVGRMAKPQEIAFAALFLASDHASYINGVSLPVDGGRLTCL